MHNLGHANTGWVQSVSLTITPETMSPHNYLHDVTLKGYSVCETG